MRAVATNRVLPSAQANLRRDMQSLFRRATNEIGVVLSRSADGSGKIPTNQQLAVRETTRGIISRLFTSNQRAFAQDGVSALSPFADLINQAYVDVVSGAVFAQYKWMMKNVPEDVFRYLSNTTARVPVAEQENRVFRPNLEIDPTRQWVPMHNWTDENGYRLSDRIWRADQETRRKIDELLAKGLSMGQGSANLSQALEAYLIPTRTGIRTLKPYGKKFGADGASYDAMRLARTELSRAYNNASYISAYLNPYVTGWEWKLSPSHPRSDICDSYATIGMSGQRIRPPYDLNAPEVPPAHPNCLCTGYPAVTDDPKTITEQIRADMEANRQPLVTPAQPFNLIQWFIGYQLMQYVKDEVLS